MPFTLKWVVVGVFSSLSRTDPDVLDQWFPQVFTNQYPSDFVGIKDTPEECLAAFGSLTTEQLYTYLPYAATRVSTPTLYQSRSVYLPSFSPSYAEYPYTVQAYSCSFTAFRELDSPLNYTTLIIASALDGDFPPPPIDPDPVTIQLKRDAGLYSVKPSDASVLTKYGSPVQFIRAKFQSTRVAVITETIAGGFMIYEEVDDIPSGPVYIYSSKRKLLNIVSVAVIDQYRLYSI